MSLTPKPKCSIAELSGGARRARRRILNWGTAWQLKNPDALEAGADQKLRGLQPEALCDDRQVVDGNALFAALDDTDVGSM